MERGWAWAVGLSSALFACSGERTRELEDELTLVDGELDGGAALADAGRNAPIVSSDAMLPMHTGPDASAPDASSSTDDDARVADAGDEPAALDAGLDARAPDAGDDAGQDASVCVCEGPATPSCFSTDGYGREQLYACDTQAGCITEPAGSLSCERAEQTSCNLETGTLETRSGRCKEGLGCTFDIEATDSCPATCLTGSVICGGGCDTDPTTGAARCRPCRDCAVEEGEGAACWTSHGQGFCINIIPL